MYSWHQWVWVINSNINSLYKRQFGEKIEFVIISKQKNRIKPPPLSPKTRKKQENEPQRLWGHSQLWLLHHTECVVHGIDASQGHLDSGKTSWRLALSTHDAAQFQEQLSLWKTTRLHSPHQLRGSSFYRCWRWMPRWRSSSRHTRQSCRRWWPS